MNLGSICRLAFSLSLTRALARLGAVAPGHGIASTPHQRVCLGDPNITDHPVTLYNPTIKARTHNKYPRSRYGKSTLIPGGTSSSSTSFTNSIPAAPASRAVLFQPCWICARLSVEHRNSIIRREKGRGHTECSESGQVKIRHE